MGKKGVHTGLSAKDRSINLMDKFISKNAAKAKNQPKLPARRKDPEIPIHMWPLKDQIEYWETRTDADRFDEVYPAYSYWIEAVRKQCAVHPTFFSDYAIRLKLELQQMYDEKTGVKEAARYLRKQGVY